MKDTIAYIPNNRYKVQNPNAAPRNAAYWSGRVERCKRVCIHPQCRDKQQIALSYAAAGIPVVEWVHEQIEEKPTDTGSLKTGMWLGQDVVIIGGGPSLKGFDFSRLDKFPCKVIGVNRAYEFYEPDIMFSMDKQFYDWAFRGEFGKDAREKYESFRGIRVGTTAKNTLDKRIINLSRGTKLLSKTLKNGLYTGGNSGFAALHLATILGARRVYLLGFDCAPTKTGRTQNFHSGYKTSQGDDVYRRFANSFKEFASQLSERTEIINCNHESGIRCFDFGELPEEAELPPMVCYITPAYRKVYKKHLAKGVEKFSLPLTLIERKSAGSWKKNACIKPFVIEQAQRDNPDRGIVWLDADSSVERNPVLFGELEAKGVDFAAYTLPTGELLSSVLYFGNTESASALLRAWKERCESHPDKYGTADQKHLQDLCEEMQIEVYSLPPEYCKIFDHPKQADINMPVIVQHQASREMKRKKQ